jgi:hypothetical protein
MPRKKSNKSELDTPPKPGERIYWNEDTENAIVRYNLAKNQDERDRIYNDHLAYPFDKLAENIINRFKFPYINQVYDDLKRQVISHLICNLHKFSPKKGNKAYSYFSVIAKNYLIYHNTKAWKEEKISMSMNDAFTEDGAVPIEDMVQLEIPSTEESEDLQEFMKLLIRYWELNVHRFFKKKRDINIANAVIELLRRSDGIENFNKKNLYLLIREQTDAQTGYITKVLTKMKGIVKQQMIEYYEYGTIGAEEDRYFDYK